MRARLLRLILVALPFAIAIPKAMAYEERGLLEHAATKEQVKNSLVMNQDWIPYPKKYSDRKGWDEFFGPFKESIIKQGEKYLNYDWRVIKTTYYLAYERTGNRAIMETPMSENREALAHLMAAELAEGKGRFMDDIIDGVVVFSEMTSWAVSAHLASLSKTKSPMPDETENVLELFEGNTSQLLSWLYYYLHEEMDKISPVVSRRLRHEIQVRELDTYMARDDFWWMGFKTPKGQPINNWNPWCNTNAIVCFMLLENDKDKLADAIYKTMLSTDRYINWVTADGACEEGPSYWPAAPGWMLCYLDALSKITGGKVSIFDKKLIRDMGEYIVYSCIGNGYMVNFADASVRAGVSTCLTYRYGKAVGSSLMMAFAAKYYKDSLKNGEKIRLNENFAWSTPIKAFEDITATQEMAKASTEYSFNPSIWYPATEFCYLDNGKGWFVAMKGGHNNESHNHNDVGTFSLYIDKKPVLVDVGVESYTKKTFSSERYSIWTMQSQYHNLPSINSEMESFGEEYRSRNAKADIKKGIFSLDIAGAYPKEAAVRTWNRTYKLTKGGLAIDDQFELDQANRPNIINFMTCDKPDISQKGVVILDDNGKTTKLSYDPSAFSADVETIKLTDRKLISEWRGDLYRIKLTATKTTKKGAYHFMVTRQ